ncbi:cyclodehydratase [Actinomyces wuliandei]|uniref:cyclodehydratase n=1 Tax=Actinomyces wuliandei TaxID=2057743 RepID=UPI000FDC8F04|nr:cyclodehydratase [Actinomyces wuliandei]
MSTWHTSASGAASPPVTAYLVQEEVQGELSRAIVRRLASSRDVVVSVDRDLDSSRIPEADRLVLVAESGQEELREALDCLSFARCVPSLGLELHPTELRCGPLVVPGTTACYRCYLCGERRHMRPHRPQAAQADLLPRRCAQHVVLAVGLVALALDGADSRGPFAHEGGEPSGQVWSADLVAGTTSCSRIVGVQRCGTCSRRAVSRLRRPGQPGRRGGSPVLAGLWEAVYRQRTLVGTGRGA